MTLPELFTQYVQHGVYMRGWSPLTVDIYRRAFAHFDHTLQSTTISPLPAVDADTLTKAHLENWVGWMRQQQRSATYINIHIRAINAFPHWAHAENLLSKRLTLKQVPNPQTALRAISDKEVAMILAFRSRWRNSLNEFVDMPESRANIFIHIL